MLLIKDTALHGSRRKLQMEVFSPIQPFKELQLRPLAPVTINGLPHTTRYLPTNWNVRLVLNLKKGNLVAPKRQQAAHSSVDLLVNYPAVSNPFKRFE
jgi:hypothetical protein